MTFYRGLRITIIPIGICAVVILTGCAINLRNAKQGHSFHTTPDNWTESRIFHTNIDHHIDKRSNISKVPHNGNVYNDAIFSPNKAYWFSTRDFISTDESENSLIIEIFNERPHLSRIEVSGPYRNFRPEIRWINQKLLYIEIWWGRVVGTYLIYDVEKEEIVVSEALHDGNIAFQQWREAAKTQQDKSSELGKPRR